MTCAINNTQAEANRNPWTPGPWEWFGSGQTHQLYLATQHSGRRYVMGFTRWGMRGAQPEFQAANRGLVRASDLLQFEVGDRSIVGVDAARKDTSVYRYTVRGIDCADARLIAAAPELAEALAEIVDYIGGADHALEDPHVIARAHAALARARGETR